MTLRAEEPIAWRGELSLTEGRLERLQSINYDPQAAASNSLDEGRVRLHYRRAIATDVFDVTALCPPGTTLNARLSPDGEAAGIAIDEARGGAQAAPLPELKTEVQVRRLASDRLRIETDRQSLLFDPGESFRFQAIIDPPTAERAQAFDVVTTLARGRAGAEVWQGEPTRLDTVTGTDPVPVEIPLPKDEGVYRVSVVVKRPSGFLNRFPSLPGMKGSTSESVVLRRTFQLAVLDPRSTPPQLGGWREAYAFDPRVHRWSDRVPEWMRWRRLPWFARGPLSSDSRTDLQAEGNGAIEIAAASQEGSPWRAYPLPIDEVGAAYAVEVEPLGAPGERLTIGVLEPDALGDLRPLGGVITHTVPRWNTDAKPRPLRLLVRPRTDSPLLVIANPSTESRARFGRIRLLKSAGEQRSKPPQDRVIALDWSDCDLSHSVGASHAAVREANFPPYEIPDLLTHYETAIGLADRVEAAGANAAVVPVNQNGAAVFASRLWGSPYYDLGVWTDGAADLPRRELLRLVAFEFRRRGLRLVPALRFDAPSAAIESTPTLDGAYDPDAVTAHRFRGEAVLEALGALNATGRTNVLAGVAVRASAEGWALPLEAPSSEATSRRLAASYADLDALVRKRTGGRPLIVLPNELAERPAASRALAPSLGGSSQGAADLITRAALGSIGNQTLVALPYGMPREPLAQLRRVWPDSANRLVSSFRSAREPVRLIASGSRLRNSGGVDVRLPATACLPDEAASLLAQTTANGMQIVLLDGGSPAGSLDTRIAGLARQLLELPTSGLNETRSADAESRDAPTNDFATNGIDTPDGRSLASATNLSAWKRRVRLTLTTPSRLQGVRLRDAEQPEWFEPGRHAIDLEIAPFATAAWRFSGPGARIEGVRIEPATEAQRELAESLADLQSRDTTVRRRVALIPNSSFETAGPDAAPESWERFGEVEHNATVAIDGAASVRLRSTEADDAVLLSTPFDSTKTGQLAVFLRTKAIRLADDSQLRLELFEVNGDYRSATRLAKEQLSAVETDGWSPSVLFPNEDLPHKRDTKLRLRLTLSGDAEVHVDQIETEDLILPLDGFGPIEKRAEKFALVRLLTTGEKLLAEGRLEACRELLDSYWAGFLRDNFPQHGIESTATAEVTAESIDAAESDQEQTPSVSERLRGYLPRWWR